MASTASRAAASGKQRMAMSQALMASARRRGSLRSAAASVNSLRSVRLRSRSWICNPVVPWSPSMKTTGELIRGILR